MGSAAEWLAPIDVSRPPELTHPFLVDWAKELPTADLGKLPIGLWLDPTAGPMVVLELLQMMAKTYPTNLAVGRAAWSLQRKIALALDEVAA